MILQMTVGERQVPSVPGSRDRADPGAMSPRHLALRIQPLVMIILAAPPSLISRQRDIPHEGGWATDSVTRKRPCRQCKLEVSCEINPSDS